MIPTLAPSASTVCPSGDTHRNIQLCDPVVNEK